MAQNWWDQAPVVGQRQGRVITDPYKQAEEDRKRRESERQDIELGLRRDDAARANAAANREQSRFNSEQRSSAATGGVDYSVEQGRAANFYKRALESNTTYGQQGVGPRGYFEQKAANNAPDLINQRDDPARQVSESAIRNFVAATLRYESGAAIPPEELDTQKRIFFPMPGDGPEVIAAKEKMRQDAIEGLRIGAGPAASLVPQPTRLPPDELAKQLQEKLRKGEGTPAGVIKWLIDNGGAPTEDQTNAIIAAFGNKRVVAQTNPNQGNPGPDLGRAFHMGVGDVAQGAGNLLGLVGNPVNAALNWTGLPQALGAGELSTDLGRTFRGLTGAPDPASSSERFASALNQGGTGGLGFAGAARSAVPITQGLGRYAASRIAQAPLIDTISGATSGLSGEAARQAGAGPIGQIGASLIGGLGGAAGASRISRMVAPGAPPPLPPVVQAGQAEGIAVPRALADPRLQPRVTGTQATIAGAPRINAGLGNVQSQIERGVQRLGMDGQAMTPNVGGQQISGAANRYIQQSGAQARKLYDAAEKGAGGLKVAPAQSLQVVDDVIARLSETPEINAQEISFLQKLRSDFSKDLSVGALRDVRTSLRKKISKGELSFGQNEANVLAVMDAASDDIANGLAAAGKRGVAQQFKRADAFYRDRQQFIGGVVQKLIGKRNANNTPEAVFSNFRAMASPKGDEAGLARMMRAMDPEERADIAATFADELGKNNKGEFTTAQLVAQAQKLPAAAKINLFGEDGAQSLRNLEILAKEHDRVSRGLNNSRTGIANDLRSQVIGTLFSGFSGAGTGWATGSPMAGAATTVAGLGTVGAKAARDALSARALMSTDLTKWIRTLPATNNPAAINRHMDRLAVIAARNPALQAGAQSLQQMVFNIANDNIGQVRSGAASPLDEEERRKYERRY